MHFEEIPTCPCTPLVTQRQQVGWSGEGHGPSQVLLGITFVPSFCLTPHPTSHHKAFKLSKGERMEPELLAGLPDFGLLGSALSSLIV